MVKISDSADYSNEQSSIKEIIIRHIEKISNLTCKEFIGGYWEQKPVSVGGGVMMVKKYHEDVREAYCNAVDFLRDTVYAWADKDFKEYADGHSRELPEIKDKVVDRKLMYKKILIMFERSGFLSASDTINE